MIYKYYIDLNLISHNHIICYFSRDLVGQISQPNSSQACLNINSQS